MNVVINKGIAKGKVMAPPSKSMAHRYLIAATLAGAGSEISNVAFSKDIEATLNCLKSLGAEFNISDDVVKVLKGIEPKDNIVLDCNESGSTLRFFIPIALSFGKDITFVGSQRLFERPLDIYENICEKEGLIFSKGKSSLKVNGILNGGEYKIPGDISSQFITGLIFALSLKKCESRITLTSHLQSKPYIDLTIDALKTFGVDVLEEKDSYVINHSSYKPQKVRIEGDYSNAAFFEALNYLGSEVKVEDLNPKSLQGDKVYLEYFKKLKEGYSVLDISNCPDLAPVLMVVAAANNGAKLIGTNRLKIKESDRGMAMQKELEKFGCSIEIGDDYIIIPKSELKAPNELLKSHNDHRIVMAFSVLGTKFGCEIEDAQAIDKSMPDFFQRLKSLNIEVIENGTNKK